MHGGNEACNICVERMQDAPLTKAVDGVAISMDVCTKLMMMITSGNKQDTVTWLKLMGLPIPVDRNTKRICSCNK